MNGNEARRILRDLDARNRWSTPLGIVLIVILLAGSSYQTGTSPVDFITGLPDMADLLRRMWPPDWSYVPVMAGPLLQTMQIAILATTVGAVLAIPLSLLGARNLTRVAALYWLARMVMNFVRTLPDILLAALFVVAFGIGPVPGVVALSIFSLGLIGKTTSESLEAIDNGPLEAMLATGATWLMQVRYAALPQVLPQFMSYVLYTFEVNVRAAAVLGLVGAGGIGVWLLAQLHLFQYRRVSAIIIMIFVFVAVLDYLSGRIRRRLI